MTLVPGGEFAPGIPMARAVQPLPRVAGRAQTWEFTLHAHDAERAGRHFDMRLGDRATGHAHSWAMRYWPQPGETKLAVEQATHTLAYMDFSGAIASGYGKGHVALARRERAEILESGPDAVRFNLYPGQRVEEYLLRRTNGRQWILRNVTPTRASKSVPDYKPKYREQRVDKLDARAGDGDVWQAKIDGAHVLIDFTGSRPRFYSYRAGKRTDLINHTPKVPGFEAMSTPPELRGSMLRGELTAVDARDRALASARVGGILNAGVWASRDKQRDEGRVVVYAIDVVRWRGKDVESEPYAVKREMIAAAARAAPWLRVPRTAVTPAQKTRLLSDIARGREKSTEEGVVTWGLNKSVPVKAKLQRERDVYVRGVFAETGARQGLAGGFEFATTPGGPVVGRVGTGMSHALKRDMLARPALYAGLKARVRTQPAPERYAPRMPVFAGWHLDQQLPEGVKTAAFVAGVGEGMCSSSF